MTVETTISNPDGSKLLGALYPEGTEGYLEYRAIRDGRVRGRYFIPVGQSDWGWCDIRHDAKAADIYFSVAPRTREEGTKDAIAGVSTAWVDLDTEGASDRLAMFELAPSFIVSSGSGGHLHAYWPLTTPESPAEIEQMNRRLAERLGGDPASVDASRMMRLPGTFNFKHEPPARADLVEANDRRFTLDEIWSILGSNPESAAVANGNSDAIDASAPVVEVLKLLKDVKPSGKGWTALCPAHGDRRPSLKVDEGKGGCCLIHCFAGCTPEAIVGAIGLSMSDLFNGPEAKRAGSRLVAHVERAGGIACFRTRNGVPFASIGVEGHRETWAIRSAGFGLWLRSLHYEATSEAASEENIAEAVATFEAQALFGGDQREVHIRVAAEDDRILIDLGDESWRAIEVDAEGWRLIEEPDVHFIRDRSTLPLPVPVEGGTLEDLRPFTNCANHSSWLLLCGSLVMCFNPWGPFPVIYPTGEQGSAKSTLSRIFASVTDPRVAPLSMGTPSVRDLAVVASSVWLVGFDNVSKVSPELSDALCQLTTGGGYRTRQLYTDAEPFILELKRPVLINGIGQVITRPDLLDRVALIELAAISPAERRTEEEFWAAWEPASSRVLGALLDGVVSALANAEDVELEGYPRMADFARWSEAAGIGFGWMPGAFTAALEAGREDLLEGSAEAHPEIGALLKLMDDRGAWKGTATELLDRLSTIAGDAAKAMTWPKRPDVLSNRLKLHAPLLREHGIEVERGKEGGGLKRFLLVTKDRDAGTRGDAS